MKKNTRMILSIGMVLASAFPALAQERDRTAKPAATQTAVGVVFEDLDGDESRNPREPGIEGVRVSNGTTFVTTDENGRYEIAVTDDTTLFVVKPRNYATTIDGLNLPRFYYHHVPAGTADEDFIFEGIEPTGPLPESVDFPLYAQTEPEQFRVVLFGDPQVYTVEELTWYARDVVSEFARLEGVAFGIALGDLVGDNLDLFEPYNQANAQAHFPWYNVLGNHDINYMAGGDRESDATFRRVFGPSTYMFQYGKAHFIILNNVYWNGFRGLRRDGWPQRGNYEGRIRPDQLALIRQYVQGVPADEAIVVASHIPMENVIDGETQAATPEYDQLLEILSSHDYTFSASGHTHIHRTSTAGSDRGYSSPSGTLHFHHNVSTLSGTWYAGPHDERGVPLATQRDGTPRGYAIVEFDGADYRVRYQALGMPETEQMRIHLPDLVESGQEIQVQANIYDGSHLSKTRMRLLDAKGDQTSTGDWMDMRQESLSDPLYVALQELSVKWAHEQEGRRELSEPVATDHNWVASVSTVDLDPGLYAVEVETTDAYGQKHVSRRALRVVESLENWKSLDANSIRTPRDQAPAAGDAGDSADTAAGRR